MIPVYLLNTGLSPTFNLFFFLKSNQAKHNKVYLFYDIQYKVCIVGSYFKIYYTLDYFFPPVTTQNQDVVTVFVKYKVSLVVFLPPLLSENYFQHSILSNCFQK